MSNVETRSSAPNVQTVDPEPGTVDVGPGGRRIAAPTEAR